MSTNYYDVIARSLAKIDASEQQVRVTFYERARSLLSDRLRASDPPLAPATFAAEIAAFDAAIARVEAEYTRRSLQATVPPIVASRPAPHVSIDNALSRPDPKPRGSRRGLGFAIAAAAASVALIVGGLVWRMPRNDPAPAVASSPAPVAVAERGSAPREQAGDEKLPYFMRRQVVYYRSTHPAGTIVITKSQHYLYVVKSDKAALRYTIALGSDCADSGGLYSVASKDGKEPPVLLLDKAGYRIRATDVLAAIGQAASSQGFQLLREDIADLDERTPLGTRVVVTN